MARFRGSQGEGPRVPGEGVRVRAGSFRQLPATSKKTLAHRTGTWAIRIDRGCLRGSLPAASGNFGPSTSDPRTLPLGPSDPTSGTLGPCPWDL